jgi:hypothetical protein
VRATFTREGQNVGVFIMTRDGDYEWDCSDQERERFEAIIEKIIEELREPHAMVGRSDLKPVTYKPGDPRWFDRVLARLQNKGYEHVVVADWPQSRE